MDFVFDDQLWTPEVFDGAIHRPKELITGKWYLIVVFRHMPREEADVICKDEPFISGGYRDYEALGRPPPARHRRIRHQDAYGYGRGRSSARPG